MKIIFNFFLEIIIIFMTKTYLFQKDYHLHKEKIEKLVKYFMKINKYQSRFII